MPVHVFFHAIHALLELCDFDGQRVDPAVEHPEAACQHSEDPLGVFANWYHLVGQGVNVSSGSTDRNCPSGRAYLLGPPDPRLALALTVAALFFTPQNHTIFLDPRDQCTLRGPRHWRVDLLEFLVSQVEPFRAEVETAHSKTTATYSKLAALRFIPHIHGVIGYSRMDADELTQELKNLL